MANSITASGITDSQVTLNYEIDNSGRAFTVYAYIFLAKGDLSFSTIEASAGTYLVQQRGIGPFSTLSDSITVTGLDSNSRYSFMYSVTDANTFNSADVIFRRPLNPPGTFDTEGAPVFTDTTLANATQGDFYSDGVSASDATSYTLISGMPSGLSLNTNNGSITGTPNVNGSFSIAIDANNSFGSTRANVSLFINPPAPVWVDQTISSPAFIDAPYNDGVSATYATSYSISSGSLPTGLSLNTSTGAITGTPTVEETQNFTIQASNTTGTISVGLTLEIISGLAPPTFTDSTLSTDLRVGIAYSDSVSATDAESYSFVGTQPTGLTIDNSGNVTGTPTAQGEFVFDIRATNAAGSTDAPFTLFVKPGGERYDGTAFQRIDTMKRYDGTAFVDVQFVKRYDGTAWVDANL